MGKADVFVLIGRSKATHWRANRLPGTENRGITVARSAIGRRVRSQGAVAARSVGDLLILALACLSG